MKLSAITLGATATLAVAAPASLEERASTVQGFDISSYQPNVDFKGAYANGARFVIIKVHPHPPPFSCATTLTLALPSLGHRRHQLH